MEDLRAIGGDLDPLRLIAAYRAGLFPMGVGEHGAGPIGWFCPRMRGVLPLGDVRAPHRWPRSLRQSAKHFELRVDTAFEDVVRGCADPGRPGRWITRDVLDAYATLHRMGVAHSVETWSGGELVGGLYGVGIGGLFAGESMFHTARDASKVALVHLAEVLTADGRTDRLLDTQWQTPHLASLGVVEIPADEYLARLRRALDLPAAPWPERVGNTSSPKG